MDKQIYTMSGMKINHSRYTPKKGCGIIRYFCRVSRISASATVEAALVIPLYVYAIMAIAFLLNAEMIKKDISCAAYNSIRAVSKYSYAGEYPYDGEAKERGTTADDVKYAGEYLYDTESEISEKLLLYTCLIKELGTEYADRHYIVNGNAGINISASDISTYSGEIKLTIAYSLKNPFDIFGMGNIKQEQSFCSQSWLGEAYSRRIDTEDAQETVYITEHGSVYHTHKNCAYLELSVHQIAFAELETARNLSGGKYYKCEKCGNNQNTGMVYVTNYGDNYHTKNTCSRLKRTVIRIKKDLVSDMDMCKKCAEKEK